MTSDMHHRKEGYSDLDLSCTVYLVFKTLSRKWRALSFTFKSCSDYWNALSCHLNPYQHVESVYTYYGCYWYWVKWVSHFRAKIFLKGNFYSVRVDPQPSKDVHCFDAECFRWVRESTTFTRTVTKFFKITLPRPNRSRLKHESS